jgi:acyl-CoA synthetase (AMP-forming)/AMP-acid ligase II
MTDEGIKTGWTFPWAVTAVRGTHYCLRKINYPNLWHLLHTEPITHFCAALTVNTFLCRATEAARLHHPVRVMVAASPPSAVLFERMTQLNLHPMHAYGLTETYGPMTMSYFLPEWNALPQGQKYENMARQGHGVITALPVRVVKTHTGSQLINVAKDGLAIGEIIVQGNMCAKGYYKDQAATEKLFTGGWMHTGDLAVWHADGAIQILDRAKDIIISGK